MPQLVFYQFIIPLSGRSSSEVAPSDQNPEQSPSPQSQSDRLRVFVRLLGQGSEEAVSEDLIRDIMNGQYGYNGNPKPPSMDPDARKKLPQFTYTKERAKYMSSRKSEGCTVCLDAFEDAQRIVSLPCGHYFHLTCISPWLDQHNTCPMCRYKMKVSDADQDAERVHEMEQRFGKTSHYIIEIASDIERLFSIAYELRHSGRRMSSAENSQLLLQLQEHTDALDSLDIGEDAVRKQRKDQILKIQQAELMIEDVKPQLEEDEKLDAILESSLQEMEKRRVQRGTSSTQKMRFMETKSMDGKESPEPPKKKRKIETELGK